MKKYALFVLILALSISLAAQSTQAPPVAPVSGSIQQEATQPDYVANDRPLTGVQNLDVGTPSDMRDVLTPSFSVGGGWDSAPPFTAAQSAGGSSGLTNLGARLNLLRDSKNEQTTLSYSGGGQVYTANSSLNSLFQALGLSQGIKAGRWDFLLADNVAYTKDAYGAYFPLLFPGQTTGPGGIDLRPGVGPNDSILNQQAGRISNTAVGQVSYGFTRMTSVTGSFSYGLLHFYDGGFLDSDQYNASGGLNHRFGRNTVGVNYSFVKFSYANIAQDFMTNTVQASFSRVLTGRLAFEVGGGPTMLRLNSGPDVSTRVYGSGHLSLRYRVRNTTYEASYTRAITGGSGVLPGAVTDSFGGGVTRDLTRTLTVNVSGGYARNSGTFVDSVFNTSYTGAGFTQALGRNVSLSIGYSGRFQLRNAGVTSMHRNTVIASLNWNLRPIRLQ